MTTTSASAADRHATAATSAAVMPRRRITARATALTVLLALVLGLFGAIFATSSAHAAEGDENDDLKSLSFYKAASSMTSFWSSVQAPPGDADLEDRGVGAGFQQDWPTILSNDPGSAGSLLGYLDPKFSFSPDWLAAKFSGSSDAIGYDSLDGQSALKSYALFGATLKGLGLDNTSTGLSLNFLDAIGGGIMGLLYIMSGFIEVLFVMVIGALKMLNPFNLLYLGVAAINPTFASGMVGGSVSPTDLPPAIYGLAMFIRDWYVTLSTISWAVILPIFLGVLVMGLLLFRNMNRGSAIKKFVVRCVFITLGIPLLGSMYTATLNSFDQFDGTVSAGATRVVMSTYVDFGQWARTSRLAVPSGATIQWNTSKDEPTSLSQMNVRRTALMINTQSFRLPTTVALLDENTLGTSWSNAVLSTDDNATGAQVYLQTTAMLFRYMSKEMVPASSLESEMKATMDSGSATTRAWFTQIITEDPKPINDMEGDGFRSNPVIFVQGGTGLRASSTANGPSGVPGTSYYTTFTSNTSGCIATASDANAAMRVGGSPRPCNLAPLALYNYLNTDFGPSSMVMYSSGNVQSEATRSVHTAVNLVGTGPMPFLYWLNAAFLLLSFIVIGFAYGFSMIFGAIKRTIQGITAVPFALMGSMAAIAKVSVYFIALILQILVTVFAYKFVQEFLISLPQIIEMPLAAALSSFDGSVTFGFLAFLLSGTGLGIGMAVVSIVALIAFTVMALKLRSSLMKALEEAVEKVINKFLESQPSMPRSGGMMPALAAGAAGGLGAAAAGRMMSNNASPSHTVSTTSTGPSAPSGGVGGPVPGGSGGPSAPGGSGNHPGNGISGAGGGPVPGGSGSGGGSGTSPTTDGRMAKSAVERQGPSGSSLSPNPQATSGREHASNIGNLTVAGASKGGVHGAAIGAAAGVVIAGAQKVEDSRNASRSSLDGAPKQNVKQVSGAVQQGANLLAMGKGTGGPVKGVVPPK